MCVHGSMLRISYQVCVQGASVFECVLHGASSECVSEEALLSVALDAFDASSSLKLGMMLRMSKPHFMLLFLHTAADARS